jgi:NAD(P)-dependent dehydrogenase (short-subunit alcohol dehydrogenase family)
MSSLKGRVALVTGGSRGIGAATVRRLAADGADVALTYGASAEKAGAVANDVERAGRRALLVHADLRNAAAAEAAVQTAYETFGRLDILVNNAGIFEAAPINELSLEHFEETIAVNVRAVFAASQVAAARMSEGGRIISIASNLAHRAPSPGLTLYSLSKAAVIGFTRALARELGPRGITVNSVSPGSTDTDMNPADGPAAPDQLSLRAIPRFNHPEEVAAMVAWLAGPEAASVTGADFLIDGGANV